MKLIVGLGNPGKEYQRTRHNAGFLAIDELASNLKFQTTKQKKFPADIWTGRILRSRAAFAKPLTYMNNSGEAVQAIMKFFKLKTDDLLVIHDDKDIPLGETRVQKGRGAAGHNGVQSIIDRLGSKDFWRIRVGVAPTDRAIADTADFVLGKFTKEEQRRLRPVLDRVIEEVKKLISS